MSGRTQLYPPLIPKGEVRAYGKMPWDPAPGITFPLRSVMLLNGAPAKSEGRLFSSRNDHSERAFKTTPFLPSALPRPYRWFNRPMNSCASSQETFSTGQFPHPENLEGFDPITACHSPCVTSYLPSQYPRLIRTCVSGCSLLLASALVEPIGNSPDGTHTNSIPSNSRDSPTRCPDSAQAVKAASRPAINLIFVTFVLLIDPALQGPSSQIASGGDAGRDFLQLDDDRVVAQPPPQFFLRPAELHLQPVPNVEPCLLQCFVSCEWSPEVSLRRSRSSPSRTTKHGLPLIPA